METHHCLKWVTEIWWSFRDKLIVYICWFKHFAKRNHFFFPWREYSYLKKISSYLCWKFPFQGEPVTAHSRSRVLTVPSTGNIRKKPCGWVFFLTQVIMVRLYQWRGNLLILVVLTIQLSVLSLNIMIFKIRFIHKCLQLLYLNSFQRERPVSFVFKSCKFTCRKIATMIFKSDILITYVKESQGSIFSGKYSLQTLFFPCICP